MIEFSIEKSSSSLLISNFAQKRASEKVDRNQASIYNQADTNQIEICLLWSYKARLEVKKFINLGMKEFPAIDTTEE